ncbi:GntR family transcriptional regulator [Notoacmeibacter sp. MSK16QG-6]|uniref:GntR family transcriptional regulator n=1 Tax=Notoacmeibacter sp. MSK16QG-6 TaxID=2957982 RepID=UPI00209FDCF0|nr:GntR family transcriptional regulator [Notoacmeibacter sp. MSK16QG-6]MCP1200530.1 GntR family transcriptional regulator [Notoacmeibacter sp. MSK16QG-6]
MDETFTDNSLTDLVLDGEGPPYQQIERAIRNKIQSGAWPPGHRLPTEEELAAHLGVSRSPLVKVFKNLVNTKVITRRRRHGTFVSERSDNHAVIGVIDIRQIIESAGKSYSFQVLERRIVSGKEIAVWPEVSSKERLLWIALVHKANDIGEVFEERLIQISVVPEVEDASFNRDLPNEWLLARLPSTRLVNTVRAAMPERRIAQALGLAAGEPVLVSERRSFANDDAVTWVRLSFPGYRHEFTGEFNPLLPVENSS